MSGLKSKTKPAKAHRNIESGFAETAKKAMRQAQAIAARENAWFGLPLLVAR
jgi:hypothetical protein